jgi:hypothetical protein
MASYPTIALPMSADASLVEAWVDSKPMRDLVTAFGGTWPQGSLRKVLTNLDVFSQEVWDFRAGRERHLARIEYFDAHITRLVEAACTALGMVKEQAPRCAEYSHVVILGGMIRACIQRPAYAARLLAGGITVSEVVALGSFRELSSVEKWLGLKLGLGRLATEADAMNAGLCQAFGLGRPTIRSRHVRTYNGEKVMRSIAAPSSQPGQRANTADTYRYWAQHIATLTPGDRLLLVTSTAYVPYQHCDALRILGLEYGCEVDTVGLAPTPLPFTSANYLQEVRSALRSMRALYSSIR